MAAKYNSNNLHYLEDKMGAQIPPPGEMVDMNGLRLHAVVRGQGSPAVVLESGLGGFAMQYLRIQPDVAEFTRVVAYDRAGQAWSDPGLTPRTPENLAGELKALLIRLNIQPPYILVGHSFGGLLVRCYTGFYPAEVAGVVLVDSSDVEQYEAFPDLDQMARQTAAGVRLMKFASKIGLGKTLTRLSMGSSFKALSPDDLNLFVSIASRPGHHEGMLAEFTQHRCYFGAQSQVPRSLGNIPVTILTAEKSVSGKNKVGPTLTADQLNERHQQWQKDLVRLSSRAEQVVIASATHLSILTQPEYASQVVEAIRKIVETAR
jgi:pimeloyl-ACP methyl ester carboxylesterase